MFNPVRAEEMAFAMSIFVSAANGQVYSSAPPEPQAALREKRSCQHFILFLATEEAERSCLREAATSQDIPLFHAIFAVWEHDREDAGRLSIVARVLAFYCLMERTEGAVLKHWCDRNPEGEETVLLHPAVIEALATVPLGSRGQLHADEFIRAVEAAAETPARTDSTKAHSGRHRISPEKLIDRIQQNHRTLDACDHRIRLFVLSLGAADGEGQNLGRRPAPLHNLHGRAILFPRQAMTQ